MRVYQADVVILLGLFFHLSTLDQGPTCVLAVNPKLVYDHYPRDLQGRIKVRPPRRLSTIPEEGATTRRPQEWVQRVRTELLAGRRGRPITNFIHHRQRMVAQLNVPNLGRINPGRG
ncbi:uncharacterized protein LOC142768590 [Rhipicephalus microplus]|uniref:uncharacterized protein LOC142768590 n=1 Tax=Rhipicephalus microplus TaxID=6941 RepID=UPI003F6B8CB4